MLPEILVKAGNCSSSLDFSITQPLCGMQNHACVYSLGMSTQLGKAHFTFMSILLSIHMYQCGSLWMYFCEI
jgi:hypothetical protein